LSLIHRNNFNFIVIIVIFLNEKYTIELQGLILNIYACTAKRRPAPSEHRTLNLAIASPMRYHCIKLMCEKFYFIIQNK